MLILLGLTLIVANRRTSHAHAAGRRRIPWFLEGIAAASVRVLDASLLKAAPMARGVAPTMRVWYPMSWMVALLGVLVRLAIAMFYAGALDPALAIQRTAVAGMLGGALISTSLPSSRSCRDTRSGGSASATTTAGR